MVREAGLAMAAEGAGMQTVLGLQSTAGADSVCACGRGQSRTGDLTGRVKVAECMVREAGLAMAAERAGMRARLPSTAASSARVHQCVDRLPSSCTSQGTQPSFPAGAFATHWQASEGLAADTDDSWHCQIHILSLAETPECEC